MVPLPFKNKTSGMDSNGTLIGIKPVGVFIKLKLNLVQDLFRLTLIPILTPTVTVQEVIKPQTPTGVKVHTTISVTPSSNALAV